MTPRRILFIVTSADRIGPKNLPTGYFFPEVAHAHLVFTTDGHEVEYASIKGGEPPMEGFNEADPASVIYRESAAFKNINNSNRLSDVDVSEFDGIYFPGGHGPMVDLFREEIVKEAIRTSDAKGGVIGAVCHGPAALLGVAMPDGSSFLSGRRVAAFSRDEEIKMYDIENLPFVLEDALITEGAKYEKARPLEAHVISDGNLVTGQNPASTIGVARGMLNAMHSSKVRVRSRL